MKSETALSSVQPKPMNTIYQPSRKNTAAAALALAATFAFAQLADATAYTWNVANGNWSDPNSWTSAAGTGVPAAADTTIFGANNTSANATTVNNTVDVGFGGTVAGLTYNSILSGAFNVTQIPAGTSLTVAGPLLVGGISGNPIITQAYLTGGGTLLVTGSSMTVQDFGSSSANSIATLNLAGLGTFIYSNSAGTISVEDNVGSLTRVGGSLTLAAMNFITATNLNFGTGANAQGGAGGQLLTFGSVSNVINTANITIGAQKNSYAATNTGGSLRIRGIGGTDTNRANITVGTKNVGGGSGGITGSLFLNGCAVDIKAATLTVGANTGGTPNSGGDSGVGVMQIDTGTVDATGVAIGLNSSANFSATVFASAIGTLTVSTNATLIAGTNGIILGSQAATGPATGILNIVGGKVVSRGNITTATNLSTSTNIINFITGGKLVLGTNNYVGTTAAPISSLNLIEGSTLEFNAPLVAQTNIVLKSITWPVNDSQLTIALDAPPVTATNGTVVPLISYNSISGGTFTAPTLTLPPGITGSLSLVGNTIYLTITGGILPGMNGLNQLGNPGFELGAASWIGSGNVSLITVGGATYYNQGACGSDPSPQLVISHSGTQVGNVFGNFTGGANTSSYVQSVTVLPGDTFAAGAYALVSHEDMMTGANSFYYRVDFLDANGVLLTSYQSFIVTNLTCGETTPFALDTWNFLGVTNQIQVTGGANVGTVIGTVPSGILTTPPNAVTAKFSVLFVQQGPPNQYDGGSVYFDDLNFGFFNGPVPPTISAVTPNLVAFATNTTLNCTAASTKSTISTVQVVVTSNHLGSLATTVTNTATTPGMTVTGIGTPSVSISYALATNTVYSAIVVKVTDANGFTTTSKTNLLDTLTPTLVIESADFNFQNGGFLDTTANGGFAFYTNRIGVQSVDENKAVRVATTSYYRTNDAVVIQGAAPNSGNSSMEQKFVNSAAAGDTTNVELEVGYNTPGDWLNYTCTFGGSGSAPAGTYNVYCYLATSGTGTQLRFSQVTSDPTQAGQTTNFLGYFGTTSFSDNGYNTFVYVPLTDQFGNPVAVTIAAGQQTFKSTVVGNPNIAFYMLVPVIPVLTPVLQNVYPNGTAPYQTSGTFTFTVGPANGAALNTNGISLTLNGINVTSGLAFTQVGGSWTATYNIQTNQQYTAVINVTNTSGLSASYTVSFDSFDQNAYQWEAVDYDFTLNGVSAQFIDNPVPTAFTNDAQQGIIAANSYFGYPGGYVPSASSDGLGALAKQGVDINFPDLQTNNGATPNANSTYRADAVGAQTATDFFRQKFVAAQQTFAGQGNGMIGEINIGYFDGGSWLNYTRTWPTNNFYVWGRLAGGNGAFSGTTLSRVTSGVGTSNQTLQVLGSFSDPTASGWQTYHWVQLADTNGNPVVVSLGGVTTLRLTSGNNLNAEFFLLSPATAGLLNPFNVSAALVGGQVKLSIPTQAGHNYTVYYAASLPATTWNNVGSTNINITDGLPVHVVTVPATGGQGYYRVTAQ